MTILGFFQKRVAAWKPPGLLFIEYPEFGTRLGTRSHIMLAIQREMKMLVSKRRCGCLQIVLSYSLILQICKVLLMWITDFTSLHCANVFTGHSWHCCQHCQKASLVGCYSNNLTESSQTQLNDPTSHKSEFMHRFDFLFQTSRKGVTESPAAGVDKAQSNFPEGCPFFRYLSEGCFCPKFKHEYDHDTISGLKRGHSLIKQWNKASVTPNTLQPCKYLGLTFAWIVWLYSPITNNRSL